MSDRAMAAQSGSMKARDFDDILQQVGSFGRYQKLRILLMFMPISFLVGFSAASTMFELVVPPYWCHVPGRTNTTLTIHQWKELTIPPKSDDSGKLSSCQMYDGSVQRTQNGTFTYTTTGQTKECMYGYDYDHSDFTATDPTEHEWFCDKQYYAKNTLSINMAGRAVGTLILPILADKFFGRRIMFYISVATSVIFTVPLLWIRNAPARLFFRFLQGIGYETNYLMPYIIMMELIPPNQRGASLMISSWTWTLGSCLTALVAYLAAHWWFLEIITMGPMLLCFLYWRLLPESPRWLLSKGRLRECADILLDVSATNRTGATVTREELEKELHVLSIRMPPNEPLTKAFIYPKLRLRVCLLYLFASMVFIVGGVVSFNMTILPGSYFLSHTVLALFEIPSMFLSHNIAKFFGRRFLGYFSMCGSCICLVVATFFVDHTWKLIAVLAALKVSLSGGVYVVFLVPSEILPTPIRTSGAASAVVCGMFGTALSPQLLHSGMGSTFHYWVSFGLMLVGGLCMIPIPETLGLVMPQTMLEGEELGRGRPLTSWINYWNVHKYPATCTRDEENEEQGQGGTEMTS